MQSPDIFFLLTFCSEVWHTFRQSKICNSSWQGEGSKIIKNSVTYLMDGPQGYSNVVHAWRINRTRFLEFWTMTDYRAISDDNREWLSWSISYASVMVMFIIMHMVVSWTSGLASFCQSGKKQWQKPVITGMSKTLSPKLQKMAKTTWAKNICMTNIICKLNLRPIHVQSYLKEIVYLECL